MPGPIAAFVQDSPEPAERAELFWRQRIESVVERDDGDSDGGNGPIRQVNQGGKRNHRPADGPDDETPLFVKVDGKGPASPVNPGEFQDYQP